MTRKLRVVDASRPEDVFVALREALGGGGAAVVPRSSSAGVDSWPGTGERVPQNVSLVIETSGSTGVPKRVALSADALLASAAASAGALGGQGQWLLALPAHYVAGAQVLVRSLAAETEPILYGGGHFDAERFASLSGQLAHDLRFTSLVPVQLARLVDAAEAGSRPVAQALRRFDGILVGGQALSQPLRERAESIGARIVSTYGSSETAGGCVYDGVPIGTATARVVGGQLEISGPMLAEGYLGDPERTAAVFYEADDARWYRTGDLGTVDDAGHVSVLGRADNVIISGGEKVLLDEVERTVRDHAGLQDAVVVGVEDARWGQVPVVVVETPAGDAALPALEALRLAVRERLGRAAAPARIVVVDRLARLESGKPDRVALARLAGEREA
ncbi:AMP-binding protein [Leifsonia soli]|uniref:O-succinylbenzoic acid--CoA ligase n=1 Tax=Leifsonia soli TaxID=582665 RepID=A0A852T4M1_9MICO|nr:AMP-binding protein [Leifsonia soli]NYD75554.1 O-succinylbenzoic acid--CoA ligase [Leifsonia soli]